MARIKFKVSQGVHVASNMTNRKFDTIFQSVTKIKKINRCDIMIQNNQ